MSSHIALTSFSYLQFYAVYLFCISLAFCIFLYKLGYEPFENSFMTLCCSACIILFFLTLPSFPARWSMYYTYRLVMRAELSNLIIHLIFIFLNIFVFTALFIYPEKQKNLRIHVYLFYLVLFLIFIRLYYFFFPHL